MKGFKQYLESLKACDDAIEWAGDKPVEQVVAECRRGDRLLWLAKKCGVELQPLTLAKAHCANTVRHLMSDERSLIAVDVAMAFGEGRATRDELDAAADAADDAAAAAAAAAATSAAYAAAAAATDAAYAATSAAAAATSAAADAAYAAAYADAYAAAAAYADAAAYAASYAADADATAAYAAAADAAYADAYAAAYAADAANQQQTADICRKYIGELIIEKVNQHLNPTNQ